MTDSTQSSPPLVGVIMGSRSDLRVMQSCVDMLDELGIPCECTVVSAHRTPEWMVEYAQGAEDRGLQVLIAAAGGAAHLPGMVASLTVLPVLGVPVKATDMMGLDALLSIVQMPTGVLGGKIGGRGEGPLTFQRDETRGGIPVSRLAADQEGQDAEKRTSEENCLQTDHAHSPST